jgi:hypothetical protein
VQLTQYDIITFHDYSWTETFERRIKQLQTYGRPSFPWDGWQKPHTRDLRADGRGEEELREEAA